MTSVRKPRTFGVWLPANLPFTVGDITISRLADGHRELVEYGEVWAPRAFTASFDRAGLPLLELDVELLEARFRCVDLRLMRRCDADYIETTHVRNVNVVQLVREAVSVLCYFRDELRDEEDVEFARGVFRRLADLEQDPIDLSAIQVGDFLRYPALSPLLDGDPSLYEGFSEVSRWFAADAEVSRQRGAVRHEDVARVYQTAFAQGDQVGDAVQRAFKWARSTAKNRIHAARQAGCLPPTQPGKKRG